MMTVFHLRDLVNGNRHKIKCEDVKIFHLPHYEGMTIADMLDFAQPWPIVAQSLPAIRREVLKLHRDYVSSVIYTLVGDPFSVWA